MPALKARFNTGQVRNLMNRAFSAGAWLGNQFPGALPQAKRETSTLGAKIQTCTVGMPRRASVISHE